MSQDENQKPESDSEQDQELDQDQEHSDSSSSSDTTKEKLQAVFELSYQHNQIFNKLNEFFDFNIQPSNILINQVKDQFDTIDLNQKHYVQIRTRFIDIVNKTMADELDKKVQLFKDIEKENKQIVSKMEAFNYKVRNFENKMVILQQDMKEKEDQFEAKKNRDLLFNQIISTQASLQSQLKLYTEKKEYNTLKSLVSDLGDSLQNKVNERDLELQLKEELRKLYSLIEEEGAQKYAAKVVTEESLVIVLCADVKMQDYYRRDLDIAVKQISLITDTYSMKLNKLESDTEVLVQAVHSKIDQEQYEALKRYCLSFVHKSEIQQMYQDVLPAVESMKQQVGTALAEIETFRDFIRKTDYNVLFKASKMDIEVIEKQSHSLHKLLDECQLKYDEQKAKLDGLQSRMEQFYEENTKAISRLVKEQIFRELEPTIGDEVVKVFHQFKVRNLGFEMKELKSKMSLKANFADMLEIFDQKTSRFSAETLSRQIKRLQQMILNFSRNCSQMIHIMEPDCVSMKKRELSQIQSEFENIKSYLEDSNVNTLNKNELSYIIDKNNSSRLSNRRNNSPIKPLLKPLIQNDRLSERKLYQSSDAPKRGKRRSQPDNIIYLQDLQEL